MRLDTFLYRLQRFAAFWAHAAAIPTEVIIAMNAVAQGCTINAAHVSIEYNEAKPNEGD